MCHGWFGANVVLTADEVVLGLCLDGTEAEVRPGKNSSQKFRGCASEEEYSTLLHADRNAVPISNP